MALRGPPRRFPRGFKMSPEYVEMIEYSNGILRYHCPDCGWQFKVQRSKTSTPWKQEDDEFYIECRKCGAAWKLTIPGDKWTRIGTRVPGLTEDEYELLRGIEL